MKIKEQLQAKLNECGWTHMTVIDEDHVMCKVDGQDTIFSRTDKCTGHPSSGCAQFGSVFGDFRMVFAIADDIEAVFKLLKED